LSSNKKLVEGLKESELILIPSVPFYLKGYIPYTKRKCTERGCLFYERVWIKIRPNRLNHLSPPNNFKKNTEKHRMFELLLDRSVF
jgi:hypothetical protein